MTACETCINQATRLLGADENPAALASIMGTTHARAAYLLAIALDRAERDDLTADTVATAGIRALVSAATRTREWAQRPSPPDVDAAQITDETIADLCDRLGARSPITIADVARDAGYKSTGTLKRAVGILKQPARSGDTPAVFTEAIDVDAAGAIVRALGLAPCEVPGL